MRTDNVSQVIAVDDGTSFQRGTRGVAADVQAAGGMATGGGFGGGRGHGRRQAGSRSAGCTSGAGEHHLADIKVGDSVMATGTLKGGVFTVAEDGRLGTGERGLRARAEIAGHRTRQRRRARGLRLSRQQHLLNRSDS
jgi:hypothetical protein